MYYLVFTDEMSKSFKYLTKCLTQLSKWRTLFKQTINYILKVLHDWKSTTFESHLNIYLNSTYVLCLSVSDDRTLISHRYADFELTYRRQMPQKRKVTNIQLRFIFILNLYRKTIAKYWKMRFYHKEQNNI